MYGRLGRDGRRARGVWVRPSWTAYPAWLWVLSSCHVTGTAAMASLSSLLSLQSFHYTPPKWSFWTNLQCSCYAIAVLFRLSHVLTYTIYSFEFMIEKATECQPCATIANLSVTCIKLLDSQIRFHWHLLSEKHTFVGQNLNTNLCSFSNCPLIA